MKNLFNRLSFSKRIIISMLLVVIFTSISVIFIVFIQFSEEAKTYHDDRLERKAERVLKSIDYEMDYYDSLVTDESIDNILANRIYGIAQVNEQDIVLYSLEGKFLLSTHLGDEEILQNLEKKILNSLSKNGAYKSEVQEVRDQLRYNAYKYIINNSTNEKVGIIGLPYVSDNSFFQKEQVLFLQRYGWAMLFVIFVSVVLAYILSSQITYPLKTVTQKLKETEVISSNKPLIYRGNDEITLLVDAYNDMLLKLKKQSELMAKEERNHAWQEMARQVAHEVKNPLTPMQLMVQNFSQKFQPANETEKERVQNLCESLLQQINDIKLIAEAFSDFAKMPVRKDKWINLVEVIQNSLDIFPTENVTFIHDQEDVSMKMDKSYLSRIVVNLVKNSFQAIPDDRDAEIIIKLFKEEERIKLQFIDNGIGVSNELQNTIFEPHFTTKSGGMGLGLAMVKKIIEDYNGSITYEPRQPEGSIFQLEFS